MEYRVEPLDLMQHINTKYREPFIREVINLDRDINIGLLRDAVRQLAGAFPLLNCRYDEGKNIYVGDGLEDTDRLVEPAAREDYDSLLLESPQDAFFKVSVIDNRTLIVVVSHMITDGSGFKKLLYALAAAYSKCETDGIATVMNRDFGILSKAVPNKRKATMRMLFSMMGKYKNPFLLKGGEGEATCVLRTIDRDTMRNAHAKAKSAGAILNDLFMAAYATAVCKRLGTRKISIPCTVDLRKYNPDEAGISNLTGSYNVNVKVRPDDFSETLACVARNTKAQKRTFNDIAGPMLLVDKYNGSPLEKFLRTYGGMNTSNAVEYTNLGVVDKNLLAFGDARPESVIGFSCLNKAPYFQLAVSSFDGETTLSALTVCNAEDKALIEDVLDSVCTEISGW